MGNTTNNKDYELRSQDLKYVQNIDDQSFGNLQIYKNSEGQYIMMTRRTFMADQTQQTTKNKTNKFMDFGFYQIQDYMISNPNQEFITPILHTNIKIENLCVIYEVVEAYSEYFNFTLADMITHNKEMDADQIWLCFYWFLKLSRLLIHKGWVLQTGSITLNRIFITLKGHPNVSGHHVQKPQQDFIEPIFQNQPTNHSTQLLKDSVICTLQLLFLNSNMKLQMIQTNLNDYRKKISNKSSQLVQIIQAILYKNLGLEDTIQLIEELLQEGQISIARQIKLNKFRYVIPKPQIKCVPVVVIDTISKSTTINSLQGRRKKDSSSLGSSSKRIDKNDTNSIKLPEPPSPSKSSLSSIVSIQTPMNKTMSIKSTILMNEIEARKRKTQKQMQKLTERKEIIMSLNNISSSYGIMSKKYTKGYAKIGEGLGEFNKQNILGNSIREVRPSYSAARKQPWNKKVLR